MSNRTREFGLFIDGLRIERDISREDFCDGIMSLSQYKRYLRGDTSIPNGRLVLIADRLKFSINEIHILFSRKHDSDNNKVLALYRLVHEQKINQAYKLGRELGMGSILSDHTTQMYDFCMLIIQHSLKLVSDIHVLDLYSKLIDYPNCIQKSSFNMVEISTLIQIVNLSAKLGDFEAANFLYNILSDDNFELSLTDKSSYLPSVYSNLAKILGMQEDYTRVLEITNRGIQYCKKNFRTASLPNLFFYNSLAHLVLNQRDKALESAKKTFMLVYVEGSIEKFNFFKHLFEKQFKMKLDDLIKF